MFTFSTSSATVVSSLIFLAHNNNHLSLDGWHKVGGEWHTDSGHKWECHLKLLCPVLTSIQLFTPFYSPPPQAGWHLLDDSHTEEVKFVFCAHFTLSSTFSNSLPFSFHTILHPPKSPCPLFIPFTFPPTPSNLDGTFLIASRELMKRTQTDCGNISDYKFINFHCCPSWCFVGWWHKLRIEDDTGTHVRVSSLLETPTVDREGEHTRAPVTRWVGKFP